MDEGLCIFLSHKLGDSERNARRVAGDLAMFGGRTVTVLCSANFERGEEWEPKIREGLMKAHWLILLYTGPNVEWDWCLYETGFFRALMEEGNHENVRRLICLHDPLHQVPAPLRGFKSVPATPDAVMALFEDIYLHDPWKLNPNVFKENSEAVQDAVSRVCEASRLGASPKYNLQIAPGINIRVKRSEVAKLGEGAIPPSSPVTGEGIWETVFGKPEGTAGWTWSELTEGVEHISAWEYQLSAMMAEAVRRRAVQYTSIPIRITIAGNDVNDIYRVGLRRFSEYKDDYEFAFVLSRIRLPFEPADDDRETMLYHLFNLAWHFRRRFVEHYRQQMEDLTDSQDGDRASGRWNQFRSEFNDTIRNLAIDLKAMEADSQVRGVDRRFQIRRAFSIAERDKLDQLLNVDFPSLLKKLNEAILSTTPNPCEIRSILAEMDPINKWFYVQALKELLEGVK